MQWSDTNPPLDQILDDVTLYWFTESFPRAIYGYRQFFAPTPQFFHNDEAYYCKKPLGYSLFPEELAPIPVSIVAKVCHAFLPLPGWKSCSSLLGAVADD